MNLDHSVYPDVAVPPDCLAEIEERADYLYRVCSQWDYGIVPEPATLALLAGWRELFDAFPVRHSAAYHTFRMLYGWEPIEGRLLRATYELYDLREERTDPCGSLV